MTYKALYRKWRPKIFEDVVGQQHVVKTLKNQMRDEKISHAYLFSGTRGTGKTSTAKIFARAINCNNPIDNNPCNECAICTGILSESIMDVMEIDAASNNGVDHIREIRENVKYPPSRGRYKVYIVDEVHMLSTGAFNALLKTLEEPPSHVIFILATTEPHKLPATILSRCQRFDFKPVKTKEIFSHILSICDSMEIKYEEKALWVIAANGRGSIRDSLSILEQCISFTQGELLYDKVADTMGLISDELLHQLIQAIGEKEPSQALTHIQKVVMEGKDVQLFIKDLIKHLRILLMEKMKIQLEDLYRGDDVSLHHIAKEEKLFKEGELIKIIQDLSEAEGKMKYATQPQIILEVTIAKISKKGFNSSVEELEDRIQQLESLIKGKNIAIAAETPLIKDTGNLDGHYQIKSKEESNYHKKFIEEDQTKKSAKETVKKPEKAADFNVIKDNWDEVLEALKKNKKAQIKAFLMEGHLVGVKDGNLIIGFKEGYGFHREALDKEATKEYIASVIYKVTGESIRLKVVMDGDAISQVQEDEAINILREKVPENILEIIEE
ncbi:DNA polymerase III subunit gamma/tau [Alkaliphilus serpentinus]|uniref:DNA-directed DNA polymerase n=1 Tax=Alkaliphilus serpentinus TaxID=1482731 RepID=A0A833HQV5_9FIRM|nr:DNA polymerase III subunit gamma/tau [Alkaliphilus serpentinus]KAB3532204.1 DNA polymerase III subunit gamma/tau [Alkaliphilus serpentinus]